MWRAIKFLFASAVILAVVGTAAYALNPEKGEEVIDESLEVLNESIKFISSFRDTDVEAYLSYDDLPVESLICGDNVAIEDCDTSAAWSHLILEDRIPLSLEQLEACGPVIVVDENGDWQVGDNIITQALFAEEDIRHTDHNGLDIEAAFGALFADILSWDLGRGASTLDAQIVGQENGSVDPNLIDKLKEFADAVNIRTHIVENDLPPATVVHRYLYDAPFGRGTNGIAAMLMEYHGIDLIAGECPTAGQAAHAMSILSHPRSHDPYGDGSFEYSASERDRVLRTMAEYGYLTEEEAQDQIKIPVDENFIRPPSNSTSFTREGDLPYGMTHVVDIGKRMAGRIVGSQELLFDPGNVALTMPIQPQLQRAVWEACYGDGTPLDFSGDLRCSAVLIHNATGEVQSIVNGVNWEDSQILWALNETQTGSTFKLFTEVAALEAGIDLNTRCMTAPNKDVQVSFNHPVTGEEFSIRGGRGGEPTLITGMVRSDNVCLMDVAVNKLQSCSAPTDVAARLGVATPMSSEHCSSVLGAQEITTLDMASAVSTIATGGIYHQPRLVSAIRLADGEIIEQPEFSERRMDEIDAHRVTTVGRLVVQNGTGKYVGQNVAFDVSGKTGTTNDGTAWFVGYTSDFTLVVNVINMKHEGVSVGGGGGVPARIWVRAMNSIVEIVGTPDDLPTVELGN